MNVAIIGGGITGLTAAYELTQKGHTVVIFEKNIELGGLAVGWKEKNWEWSLERAYHHLFTNDAAILSLLDKLKLHNQIIIKRPVTATLFQGAMYQLDSPISLLKFPGLSIINRLQTGIMLGILKTSPFLSILENYTTKHIVKTIGGAEGWRVIWEPLMKAKFGPYAEIVAASWFWARIKKRTPSLAYPVGGFQTIVDALEKEIINAAGIIQTNTTITSIEQNNSQAKQSWTITTEKKKKWTCDTVLLTIPTPLITRLVPELATELTSSLTIPHLHAQVLVLETKEPILEKIYWLNVTDKSYPFLAVVAHTNYMDKSHYGDSHLTYIGNYLPSGHQFLNLSKEQLIQKFSPYLKKLNPTINYQLSTINSYLFTVPFAQPVHELHYSTRAPKLTTSLPGVYIANMDSIFPWDRGTNYAVELGQNAAQHIGTTK